MGNAGKVRGFTLLEVVVALFIMLVGLLAMAKMQVSSIQANAFGGRMTAAVALAQYQMELLMNEDLEAAGGAFDPDANPWPGAGLKREAGPAAAISDPVVMGRAYQGYAMDWSVTANDPEDDLATVRVEVDWPNSGNPIRLVGIRRR